MTKEQKLLQKAKIKTQLAAEKDDRKRVKTLSAEEQKKASCCKKRKGQRRKRRWRHFPPKRKKPRSGLTVS